VSAVASHEAIEIFGDAEVSTWNSTPGGDLTAHELCDAVENDTYTIPMNGTNVAVSNFLLPAWFDANPQIPKFDYMGNLHAPFEMSPGGYMIMMKGGRVTQVYGAKFSAHRGAMKLQPGSRTLRRLATVA